MSRTVRTMAAVVLMLPVSAACEVAETMGPVTVTGSFELLELEGSALPLTIIGSEGEITVEEGRLRLERHGRYLQSLLVRFPGGSGTTVRESGRFGGDPDSLLFRRDDTGNTFRGTVSGDTLRLVQDILFHTSSDVDELVFVRTAP